jgi:hypothetical protein
MSGESREKALCEAFLSLKQGHCKCCQYRPPDEPCYGREWPFSCDCGADEHNDRIDALIENFGLEQWV